MASLSDRKGCRTCKDRRIKCDRSGPVCNNCRRSQRNCVREAFRVSWPKKQDRRRLIIGPASERPNQASRFAKAHFLNVSNWHMNAYHTLLDVTSAGFAQYPATPQLSSQIPAHMSALPPFLNTIQDGANVLSYFHAVVAKTLPDFDGSAYNLRDLLMKLALSDDSPSSQAVLFAVLSLSALHRCKLRPEKAFEFKSSALSSLQQCASKGNFTTARAMQHMAAAILLCRVEIDLSLNATTLWCLFVCGVNTLLMSTYEGTEPELDADIRLLYRYVHYHNGMSCFSLLHWKRPRSLQSGTQVEFKGKIVSFKCRETFSLPPFKSCVTEEIQILTDLIDVVRVPEQKGYHSQSYQNRLDVLEDRISTGYKNATRNIQAALRDRRPGDEERWASLIQRRLFVGALWIYFMRMARHLSGPSGVVSSLLADMFDDKESGIDLLEKCNLPFAIFVLGSEATSEARRRSVLDLIYRTTAVAKCIDQRPEDDLDPLLNSGPLGHVLSMLKVAWAFDDLHVGNDAEKPLDYRTKVHLVFTSSEILPALA